MSINRVIISGNLTRDPEMRATAGGTSVLNFGVAVNDRRQNSQTGEWEDVPNFIDCVVFGRRAEGIQRYLSKGTKVTIEGRLRWSQWQDRETGKNRSKIEVIVDDVDFMSSRNQSDQSSSAAPTASQAPVAAAPQAAAPQTAPVQTPPEVDVYDQDIPF